MKKTTTETVLMVSEDGDPKYIVWKNGSVKHFKLKAMTLADHAEMLEVDEPADRKV